MKIVAYKCEDTDAIFEHEKDYRNHRARFLRQKRADDRHEQKKDSFKEWLAEEKLKITSISMIGPWILANQKKLMEMANFYRLESFGHKFLDSDEFTKYEITNVTYNHNLSNSHNCPEGGVTNFGRKGGPTGYPGWRCRVAGSLKREKGNGHGYPYGGVSELVRVLTGTGGGGNESWSYDANIFLGDWPGLKAEYNKILALEEQARIDAAAAEVVRKAAQYERDKDRIVERLNGRFYGF